MVLGFDALPEGISLGAIDAVTVTLRDGASSSGGSVGGVGGGGVAPSNRSPRFTDGPLTDRSVRENTPGGTDIAEPVAARDRENDKLTYALSVADAESFDIDPATGQLRTKAPLDYEAKSSYSIIVSVSDGKSSSGGDSDTLDAFITVTVNVVNADEPGAVTLSLRQTQAGIELTATLTDPDVVIDTSVTWQWASSSDESTWTDIEGAETETYTPVTGDDGNYLRATASYTDGEGPDKTAEVISTQSGLVAGDPLILRYDANSNMMIDRSEVLTAIYDYLFGVGDDAISKTEVIKLITLYLFG